ncbi:MAG: hypothetical protein WBA16_07615 [Nonlabens sp.]
MKNSEQKNIENHTNGEVPSTEWNQIIVKDFEHAEVVLEDLKSFMIGFLKNQDLPVGSPRWKEILPQRLIKFTDQLNEEDIYEDDIAQPLNAIIYIMKKNRRWIWYSSKLTGNGFIINVSGDFNLLICLPHCMGIPHTSLFIMDPNGFYETKALRDVLTYRTWDHETFEMGPVPPGIYPEVIKWLK